MRRRLANGIVAIVLLSACALAQSPARTTGAVHGTVSIVDDHGVWSVMPSVKVSLTGPTNLTVQTDDQGNFSFDSVSPGYYAISAESTDMAATRNIAVQAGTVSEVSLEMKLVVLAQPTTVTASADQVDPREAAGCNTVGESAAGNLPNIGEHFQTLLPLVPGVLRGPDGLINMKGAHASENGSLVNSTGVTDPATGETAINIPIDVVSSIQVLSTPYDPEYGKFTGAVSNVNTKPGDFDKFRVSAQNLLPRLWRLDGSIIGIAAFTPRITFSGPIVQDRVAFKQSLSGTALSIVLYFGLGFVQGRSSPRGSIRGDVFTKGASGEPAALPRARIVLRGPVTGDTESDAQGAFAIDRCPPGTHQMEVNAPSLYAGLTAEVSAVTSSTVPVEMNVAAVTSTTLPQLTRLKATDCAFSRKVHHA